MGAPSTQRPCNRGQAGLALNHPSNLRETQGLNRVSYDRSTRGRGGGHRLRGSAWCEHRAIAEQCIENPGQAAGERDDGDVLPSAGRDAERPGPERLGLGGPAPEN